MLSTLKRQKYFLYCLIPMLFFEITSIFVKTYNNYHGDIDNRMYLGSRLLQGELPWTIEFDDKLSILSWIFSIPAFFGSVHVWQLISIITIITGGISIWWFFRILLKMWGIKKEASNQICILSAILFIYLMILLPGSISHYNGFTASLFVIATSIKLYSDCLPEETLRKATPLFFVSAFLLSITISIRPYYIVPAILILVWSKVRLIFFEKKLTLKTFTPRKFYTELIKSIFFWVCTIFALVFFINFTPYFLTDNTGIFFDGLKLLFLKVHPQTLKEILLAQLSTIFTLKKTLVFFILLFIGWFFVLINIFIKIKKQASGYKLIYCDIVFGGLLMPLFLELTFLNSHFWSHYFQLFSPFIIFSIIFMLAYSSKELLHIFRFNLVNSFIFLVFISLGFITLIDTINASKIIMNNSISDHPNEEELIAFKKYLKERGSRNNDFLYPGNMYLHWKLEESRHSFPHGALTQHIIDNWYAEIKFQSHFNISKNMNDYCLQLNEIGPSLILDNESFNGAISNCLNSSQSKYIKIATFKNKDLRSFSIYERHMK